MKCPLCKLEGAYVRLKTKEIVCRHCGAITKQVKEVKK